MKLVALDMIQGTANNHGRKDWSVQKATKIKTENFEIIKIAKIIKHKILNKQLMTRITRREIRNLKSTFNTQLLHELTAACKALPRGMCKMR